MVTLQQRTRAGNNKKRLYERVSRPIFLQIYSNFCVLSVSTIRNCASLRDSVSETATLGLCYSTYTWNVRKIEKFFDATTATLAYKPRAAISGKQLRIIETQKWVRQNTCSHKLPSLLSCLLSTLEMSPLKRYHTPCIFRQKTC